jgi:hypothetical protein
MGDAKYMPHALRLQIMKMHPRVGYKDQPTQDEWLLQVGIGAAMLDVAAERIEALEAALAFLVNAHESPAAAGPHVSLPLVPEALARARATLNREDGTT